MPAILAIADPQFPDPTQQTLAIFETFGIFDKCLDIFVYKRGCFFDESNSYVCVLMFVECEVH